MLSDESGTDRLISTPTVLTFHKISDGYPFESTCYSVVRLERLLQRLRDEGFEIPDLPVVRVEAENFNDAKRKVLALTSQYGKIENDGLYEFISDSDITVDYIEESFHFPEVNIDKFKEEYYEPTSDQDLGSEEAVEDKEWLIVCEMKNEMEQSALFEKLTHEGIKCKLM